RPPQAPRPPLKAILEAALATASVPRTPPPLAALAEAPEAEVEQSLRELRADYQGRGLELADLGGKYLLQASPACARYIQSLAPRELESPLLRTLSVIAFNQPVTQASVVRVRGQKAYEHIRELEERRLIRSKPYGHSKLLETTEQFEAYFMVSRQDIEQFKKEHPQATPIPAPSSEPASAESIPVTEEPAAPEAQPPLP
ncbi:MAG: SMC-Scp complex subunit ScpB, partial [Euryarchaeota archaeon]|nr:SMC-Scp complex subunit ScpB [Euryarchaeota archaeon]